MMLSFSPFANVISFVALFKVPPSTFFMTTLDASAAPTAVFPNSESRRCNFTPAVFEFNFTS